MTVDRRAEKAAYRVANRESIKAYNAAYRAAHLKEFQVHEKNRRSSGRARSSVDKYQQENPDKVKASRRKWREGNREYARQYHQAHKDRLREQRHARDTANPEGARARVRNRRARLKRAEGSHTAADVLAIFKAQKGKCAYPWCRADLQKSYHVDHIEALANGGSNDRRNLQILCAPCNQQKHVKSPLAWARQNGLLL